jgi:surfeit locus 1 family protein
MSAFALRPKWILSHVLVVALIITMVILGFWQLQRLDDRRERNDAIESRTAEPVVPVDDLVSSSDPLAVGDELEYRIVEAVGVYQPADEVFVRNRTLDGRPGYWVLTPLRLDDGEAVIVNRGWVPNDLGVTPAPPTGQVRVIGMVAPSRTAEGLQRDDPAEGVLTEVARPDIARLSQQIAYPLLPVYIQLEGQAPPRRGLTLLVRHAVVHLHHDRHRRLSAGAAPGGPGRAERPAPERHPRDLSVAPPNEQDDVSARLLGVVMGAPRGER